MNLTNIRFDKNGLVSWIKNSKMNKRTYIISEIGNNHNGSFERVLK